MNSTSSPFAGSFFLYRYIISSPLSLSDVTYSNDLQERIDPLQLSDLERYTPALLQDNREDLTGVLFVAIICLL